MNNVDDLEDKWWERLLTRRDNLPATEKKVIVRAVAGVGAGVYSNSPQTVGGAFARLLGCRFRHEDRRVAMKRRESCLVHTRRAKPSLSLWVSRLFVAGITTILLAGCGSGNDGNASDTNPSPTSASASPCIESEALLDHRDATRTHVQNTIDALKSSDIDKAVTEIRIAASETRSMSDTVGEITPEAQQHLLRAADAFDDAATSLNELDVDGATSWLSQAVNELDQAVSLIDASTYCS